MRFEDLKEFKCNFMSDNARKPFCVGVLGLRAIRSYFNLEKKLQIKGCSEDSAEVLAALETYAANKFSCQYGRRGNKSFRLFISFLREREVLAQKEAVFLIRSGDLRSQIKGVANMIKPTVSGFIASINLILSTLCLLWSVAVVIGFSGELPEEVMLSACFFLLFWIVTLPVYIRDFCAFLVLRKKHTRLKLELTNFECLFKEVA